MWKVNGSQYDQVRVWDMSDRCWYRGVGRPVALSIGPDKTTSDRADIHGSSIITHWSRPRLICSPVPFTIHQGEYSHQLLVRGHTDKPCSWGF